MSEDKYVDNENVSVSEPQNESNTDAQKPLSIEDALAAKLPMCCEYPSWLN